MQRTITTTFFRGRAVVKVNKASYASNAVLRCVDHLQLNSYSASHAEVYDSADGTLHAVVRRRVNGDIEILFKRSVEVQ